MLVQFLSGCGGMADIRVLEARSIMEYEFKSRQPDQRAYRPTEEVLGLRSLVVWVQIPLCPPYWQDVQYFKKEQE